MSSRARKSCVQISSTSICVNRLNLRFVWQIHCRSSRNFTTWEEGFGIPYGPEDQTLDLAKVGDELGTLVERAAPARVVLELGRFLVAKAGWYLTSVLGHQTHQGRNAVVVDGGSHQRADMCGLCLRTKAYPPIALGKLSNDLHSTDVLGNLSLPSDVMSEARHLPDLAPGDVLAFPNARGLRRFGLQPAIFHACPLPAEVAFDGTNIGVMREPGSRRTAS